MLNLQSNGSKMLCFNQLIFSRWFYHFSFDEFYVLPLSILFMLIEIVMLVIAIIFTCKHIYLDSVQHFVLDLLRSRNMLHPTFKLFLNSLILDLFGLIALWIHYDRSGTLDTFVKV